MELNNALELSVERAFALYNEAEVSMTLIKRGLGRLQEISGSNQFYYDALLYLSSGLERFLKITYCIVHATLNNSYPSTNTLRKLSHDVYKIITEEISVFIEEHRNEDIKAFEEDLDFIKNDEILNKIILIISDFGSKGRYHNLDVLTGSSDPPADCIDRWKRLEIDICNGDEILRDYVYSAKNLDQGYYERLSCMIVSRIERLVRALSRHYTLGELRGNGLTVSTYFHDFLLLMDNELGTNDYR